MSVCTVFFAGGGTGGHLYPALATAEILAREFEGVEPRFLCSDREIDARILGGESIGGMPVRFIPLPAKPFGLRPRTFWKFVASWGPSVRHARGLIREAKARGPVLVAAFGGFVAAPAVQAARVERTPVLMINLDAVPGRANRWIARHSTRVMTSAPVAAFPAWERVPPLVRAGASVGGTPEVCRERLGLDTGLKALFVTGGSQGAGSINALMMHLVEHQPGTFEGWQVVHQCGEDRPGQAPRDELVRAYKAAGVMAKVLPYVREMGLAWGAADLALSRAGAGSVAEAWAAHVPVVFLPYPYHKDQHQRFNALPLAEAGGAVIETDLIDPAQNAGVAGRVLAGLMRDDAVRRRMRESLAALGPVDGAARVAATIRSLIANA